MVTNYDTGEIHIANTAKGVLFTPGSFVLTTSAVRSTNLGSMLIFAILYLAS